MFLTKFSALTMSGVLAMVLSLSTSTVVLSQTKSKTSANSQAQAVQSPEMKKNMAEMYQKMADCMKTEKSMHDCHKEVMRDCPVLKETGSCPLMNGMEGMSHGKMKHSKAKHEKMKDMDHSETKP